MASLELPDKRDTRSDLVVDKGDGIEPPPKVVWVDELEAFIEKLLDRTLRKTTQGHNPATEKSSTSGGKKKPLPEKRVLPVAPWCSGMTNTVVFLTEYAKVRWVAKKGIERKSQVTQITRFEYGASRTFCEWGYQSTPRLFFSFFLGSKCNKAQERAMVDLNSQGWPFSCSLLSY